jgi:hypothetical protein
MLQALRVFAETPENTWNGMPYSPSMREPPHTLSAAVLYF